MLGSRSDFEAFEHTALGLGFREHQGLNPKPLKLLQEEAPWLVPVVYLVMITISLGIMNLILAAPRRPAILQPKSAQELGCPQPGLQHKTVHLNPKS